MEMMAFVVWKCEVMRMVGLYWIKGMSDSLLISY